MPQLPAPSPAPIDDYIQRLRMRNIYGPTEAAVGPPDFNMRNVGLDTGMAPQQGMAYDPNERYFENFARDRAQNNYLPGTTTTRPMDVRIGGDDYLEGQISAKDRANFDLKRADLERKRAYGEQNLDIKRGGQDIQQQRADTADWKARNPGFKVLPTKGGTVKLYNPASGETHDTGADAGTLAREEELALTGKQRMEEIGARGKIQKELGIQRGEQGLANIAARTAGQKEIKSMAPEKPMLPTQERVQQNIRARQLINSNPELAEFVDVDPTTGSFTVKPPSEGYFGKSGPSPEQYQQIQDMIFGSKGDINLPKSGVPKKSGVIKSIKPISD